MRSWTVHNPSFDVWFWTDSAVRRLLDSDFPPWLVKLYDFYPLAINRADVRKYLVLYTVGGLMADLDMQCLRPLMSLLDWLQSARYGCVLSQEPPLHRQFLYSTATQPYVTTAIILCRPRHPFVRFVLSLLPQYADNAYKLDWNENVLNSTGPMFLSEAVRVYRTMRYNQSQSQSQSRSQSRDDDDDDVLVAPSRWFLPTFDPVHTAHFQTLCLLRAATRSAAVPGRPAGCDDVLHNIAADDSYTTHHWLHSWSERFVSGPLVNVTRITRITRLIT